MMRSGNPVLNDKTFTRHIDLTGDDRMTLMGTVHKTAALLILLVLTASYTWSLVMGVNADGQLVAAPGIFGYMIGGAIGGLIFALITCFKPTWAPITAPLYAAAEGLFIGAISAF
ncbi:MAG: Bax inhibitor-1/YccA family protein, partial [Alphaproteobacteria bacterium]